MVGVVGPLLLDDLMPCWNGKHKETYSTQNRPALHSWIHESERMQCIRDVPSATAKKQKCHVKSREWR